MEAIDAVTADTVSDLLLRLPPLERLQVIARVLPETERDLSERQRPLQSLRGLCADLGPAPSAEEIDEARREAWADFPRENI
jgi:hypothetical protein